MGLARVAHNGNQYKQNCLRHCRAGSVNQAPVIAYRRYRHHRKKKKIVLIPLGDGEAVLRGKGFVFGHV